MIGKLDEVESEFEKLKLELQNPTASQDAKKYQSLIKRFGSLEEVVTVYRESKAVLKEISDQKNLLKTESDEELRALIKSELPYLEQKADELQSRLEILLLPQDERDSRDVLIEVRPGAGGDEAGLFAEELFSAYKAYCESKGFRVQVLSYVEGNVGGVKEIIASVSGEKVFSHLKYESGVHRVQRIPKTETQGRVHTSTVTVAIIPEAEDVEVKINPADVRVDTMRASGAGGQHINTTDSAIRLTHIPTGLVVYCQQERSQMKNKDRAFKILMSRLQDLEHEKARASASENRLSQMGTGDRSERIRTYNFPQSRVTDHRVGYTSHAIDEIMRGNMGDVIENVLNHFQALALKQMTETR